MTSVDAAAVAGARPFYTEFGWAYDALVERPVARDCEHIVAAWRRRGVSPPARVLDAGCGTGRYTAALARHGYRVTGLDRSAELLAVARRRPGPLVRADLRRLPLRAVYNAVLCRGVLNDVLDDDDRGAVLRDLAAALVEGGVVVLDVRDWDATVRRKTATPVHERAVDTPRGRLTFRSDTRLEPATRRLLVVERHVLVASGRTQARSHRFVMRCWTREELHAHLVAAGFGAIECLGGYDDALTPGASDRLVAIASRRAGGEATR